MFGPFGKLLCAVALAGVAVAQSISIPIPAPGTTVTAGSSVHVQVDRYVPSSDTVVEVGIAIAASNCAGQNCVDPSQTLGTILYSGPYNPAPANAVSASEDFYVTVPDWYNGLTQLTVARFYTDGLYATPELKFATTNVTIVGAHG